MFTETMESVYAQAHELAQEAAQFALAYGILRYSSEGAIVHLPMSLVPWQAPAQFVEQVRTLTPQYNWLYHQVSQAGEFLSEHLHEARQVDTFLEQLFRCQSPTPIARPSLYLNRNDCMPADTGGRLEPKQVEMNLMASALGVMSERVNLMHRYLYARSPLGRRLVPNPASDTLLSALAAGHKSLNDDRAIIVFVVLPGEVNVFDQRVLEARLWLEHGIATRRAGLEELGQLGELRNGDLYFRGDRVGVAYFRAGYIPEHYPSAEAWKARELLEHSSAISIPSAATQLANTKKMQQILADPQVLRQFVPADQVPGLLASMVRFSRLDDELEWKGTRGTARQVATAHPDDWVLKPFREGGGHNFFGTDMVSRLAELSAEEARAYILMEKIKQTPFRGVRLVNHQVFDTACVTELGFYGTCLVQPGSAEPEFNRAGGYLLRTKDETNNEGLVLGGYSYLDAVCLSE